MSLRVDLIADAEHMRAYGAGALAITNGIASPSEGTVPPSETERLARDGWMELARAVPAETAAALAGAIARLREGGLHPLFVYAFDETWAIGRHLARAIETSLGVAYDVIPDIWAFFVPADPTASGWAPHRGSYELAARDRPELLNAWVALTDATLDNSCMYVVPLDADRGYPADLLSTDAARSAGRALPASAGTALVWNANVLHWGGPSSSRARGPRVSVTFTFQRRGGSHPALDFARFDLAQRLDVIAEQVEVYAHLDRTVTPELREWAALMSGFARVRAPRKEG